MRLRTETAARCLALAGLLGPLVALPAASRHDVPATSRCTIERLSVVRDPVATYLLGQATPDTVLAGVGMILPTRWQRSDDPVYGQLVRVDSLDGPDAERVREALAKLRSSEAVLVPWAYGPGCETARWTRSARWTSPDSSGLFTLRLRPESLWVAGRPTFDALRASVLSYAYGPHTVGPHTRFRGPAGTTLEDEESLTPGEVFTLYTVLPTLAQAGDSAAIARLREWVRAHPRARERFPGTYILPHWSIEVRR